jgi:hypothetical protein
MDLLDAALEQRPVYRGKAAGGMALFDGPITIPGPNPGDKEIEVVGTDGQTNPERLDYLQRRVGNKDFPWNDMGSLYSELLRLNVTPARFEQVMQARRHFGIRQEPRMPSLHIPGHPGGRASDEPASYELERPEFIDPGPNIVPAEICYLDKRCGSYNSWDFGKVTGWKPKPLTSYVSKSWYPFDKSRFLVQPPPPRRFPEGYGSRMDYLFRAPEQEFERFEIRRWLPPETRLPEGDPEKVRRNTPHCAAAVEWLRRHGRKLWRKPTCEEHIWYAALAALTETGNEREAEFRITAGTCRARGGDCTQAHDKSQRVFAAGFTGEAGA